jgi:hypothetical protein
MMLIVCVLLHPAQQIIDVRVQELFTVAAFVHHSASSGYPNWM